LLVNAEGFYHNSPVTGLLEMISTWLDPQLVGQAVAVWSGRLLGVLAIFIVGRMLLRALTRWATAAMRHEPAALTAST
jgi:hypothetical protein